MNSIYQIPKEKRKTEEEIQVGVATIMYTQKGSSPVKRFRCPKWKHPLIEKLDNGNFSKWVNGLIDKELIANGLIRQQNDFSHCNISNQNEWLE